MRKLLAAVLVALATAAPATAAVRIAGVDTSGYPTLRVSVVEPAGGGAPTVRESGRPVTGARAYNLGQSKSVVLAVDRSESMAGASLRDAVRGALAFVGAKRASDQLEVVAFGHEAATLSRFSNAKADASSALQGLGVDSKSGTALYDAIVLAAHGLQQQSQAGHVILLLTDGRDVSSSATLEDAIAAANAAHASIYAIGISGPDFTPDALRELASRTGGAYRVATSSTQLESLYTSIGAQLARTWEVRYETAARPGDTVQIAAAAAGGSAAKTLRVAAAASGSPALQSPTILGRTAWQSGAAPVVVALLVGLLVLLAAVFLGSARGGRWLSARLAPHLGASEHRGRPRGRRRRRGERRLFHATEQVFANVRQFRALQRMLTRADMPLLAAELLYICLGSAVVLSLFFAVLGVSPLVVLLFFAVGFGLPLMFVSFKANTRVKAFDNQLPDLLITIAASLKAGHSFRHAIQAVVDEGVDPAAKEFKRVLTETQLGRPMDAALADMGDRISSKHLSFVLTAVTIQRQIGGSLAGLFDMVAETVRQRQQFARKIRGLTAMGRMSAYVLAGLPFFLAFVLTLINPAYMRPLWATSTGHTLLATALVMLVCGGLILKKIVSFKG